MKLYSTNLLPVINKAELNTLTTFTKETLDVPMRKVKKFTSADFWNIQNQRRVFYQRRFI